MDGAVHNYDFGNYMFGKAKAVTAVGTTLQPNRTAIDTGIISVEYESGDILQMMWSWGLQEGCSAGRIHDVLGEKGALLFQAPVKDSSKAENPNVGQLIIERPGGEREIHEYVRNDMFADQMEHFIDCIINDKEPKVTAKHGQESLKVALAVLESFETGKTVIIE